MIRHLQQVQPDLLVVGMGGLAGPFAQFLARMRWEGHDVPTFALPLRPTAIVRRLPHLASRTGAVRIARVLDLVGAGTVLSALARLGCRLSTSLLLSGHAIETIPTDVSSVSLYDRVFASASDSYSVIAQRDARHALWMFPEKTKGAHRLHVRTAEGEEGYVHVQYVDLQTQVNSPYGPLRLAVIHDMLAPPEVAGPVLAAGVDLARRLGADLVLLTHSHPAWIAAARLCGFLRAPSNFACMQSPALEQRLTALGRNASELYVTRGDDGVLGFA
jgi:hypothetical protein